MWIGVCIIGLSLGQQRPRGKQLGFFWDDTGFDRTDLSVKIIGRIVDDDIFVDIDFSLSNRNHLFGFNVAVVMNTHNFLLVS